MGIRNSTCLSEVEKKKTTITLTREGNKIRIFQLLKQTEKKTYFNFPCNIYILFDCSKTVNYDEADETIKVGVF